MNRAKCSSSCKGGSNDCRIITAFSRGRNLIGNQLAWRSNPGKSNINWAFKRAKWPDVIPKLINTFDNGINNDLYLYRLSPCSGWTGFLPRGPDSAARSSLIVLAHVLSCPLTRFRQLGRELGRSKSRMSSPSGRRAACPNYQRRHWSRTGGRGRKFRRRRRASVGTRSIRRHRRI